VRRLIIAGYKRCDLLILPYRSLVQDLEALGIRVKKTVIPLGVDTKGFTPTTNKAEQKQKLAIDPATTVIGYVGRVSREKNVSVLIDAFKRLQPDYNITLLIVGGSNETEMDAIRETKGVILNPPFAGPKVVLSITKNPCN
jgi:alpha-1,6-mannosyltransferase